MPPCCDMSVCHLSDYNTRMADMRKQNKELTKHSQFMEQQQLIVKVCFIKIAKVKPIVYTCLLAGPAWQESIAEMKSKMEDVRKAVPKNAMKRFERDGIFASESTGEEKRRCTIS